jgi:murein DD-endopeptidase MepM/ murein hydrolase activator NlpD
VVGGANADRSDDGEAATTTLRPPVAGAATTTTISPVSGAGDIGGRATPVTLPSVAAIGGVGGDYGGAAWMCPTGIGAVSFVDTWGAPRSGGRRHEGVDMIGSRGTPVLAVVDGVAVARENVLGGMTVSLTGVDGNRYYYAHLDGYATLGNVTAGTQIGILGQTGNAQYSVPHLHFEIHPGGGTAVDPYPTTRAHCVAPG